MTLTLNQGPFPRPALPGVDGNTGLSATPTRPGLSLAGVRLRVTRPRHLGFPVLPWVSQSRHAVVITPVGSLGRIALGTAYSNRFPARQRRRPSPCQWRVGSHVKSFEACSTFTRVTACLIAGPPRGPLSRRLRRFRYLHRRSDSFRPERTRGRGEWLPLESQNLVTAHTDTECP
jgi:hypothetical protein